MLILCQKHRKWGGNLCMIQEAQTGTLEDASSLTDSSARFGLFAEWSNAFILLSLFQVKVEANFIFIVLRAAHSNSTETDSYNGIKKKSLK